MKLDLAGKLAVVTGGSRGIGRACAEFLAKEGCDLVIAARDPGSLEEARGALGKLGGRKVATVVADLRETAGVKALADAALAQAGGRVDIVVCNAGATKRGDFLKLSHEDFLDGFALKFHGHVRLVQALWPALSKTKGAVVNVIGVGGNTPTADFTIGSAVNAACQAFTKALADRGLADGVRVNAVNPGPIETERWSRWVTLRAQEEKRPIEEVRAETRREVAKTSRGIGTPEDVARLVAFLASPASGHLHGVLVDCDGGATKGL
ncbi:MAG: SDR family oxidoreductase [Alphaproteobacteria bacterium]|nr:SDR family oxidoreductase [Alphaproteobacteria bacterium]